MSSPRIFDDKTVKREAHVTYPRALHLRRAGDFRQLEDTLRRVKSALRLDVTFSGIRPGTHTCGIASFDAVLSRTNATSAKIEVESQGTSYLHFNETGVLWMSHPRLRLVTKQGTSDWIEADTIQIRVKGSTTSIVVEA